jgi:tetratricopeptide (TPR) repeat protein/tRNA A-37 threonylcarbamoyl transferase component Bud32/TolB-like protein
MNPYGLTDSLAGISTETPACERCGSVARLDRGCCLVCLLKPALEGEGSDGKAFAAALAAVEVREADWRLGNYQILEEIGRGGMGVIYRARQRHSRRIVALKRILSYHADSQETLARFRREAEAAASLDHPNILPIYEVGEGEDGLPFFSMKYAAGGSLLQARPALREEPRRCVALMAKIARAVQCAHRQGILHRDLKPGNILLDGAGEPMVSDFGLAKWLDISSDLTRTLTIYGTPGYIAPEQARGSAAQLTPSADVYSLGAVLFDLLTGRPPLLGEHALAVIQQASEKAAPKLRTIVPGLDRDLETICAKCLERESAARYHSAGELADDLERWLEGRPILARPVAPVTRLWRWSARNPRLAASIAACALLGTLAGVWQTQRLQLVRTVAEEQRVARSFVVLPFLDLDSGLADEVLAAAIADILRADLARLGPASVTWPKAPPSEWAGTNDLREINEANHTAKARAVLTGSKRTIDGRTRISLRLMNAATGDILATRLLTSDSSTPAPHLLREAVDSLVQPVLAERNWSNTGPLARDPGMRNSAAREFIISGRQLMFRGNIEDYDASIRCLEKALEIEPNSAIAHAYLSSTQSARTHFVPDPALLERAEAEARAALQLEPELLEGHRALAGLLLQKNDFAGVLEEQLRAIEAGGPEEHLTRFVGVALLRLGRPHDALRWLEMVRRRTPNPGSVYGLIGDAWRLLADDDKAEVGFQRAMDLQPEEPDSLVGLCYLHLLRHDFDGARRLLQANSNRFKSYQAVFSDNPEDEMAARIEFFARDFTAAERLYSDLWEDGRRERKQYFGAMSEASALGRSRIAAGNAASGRSLLDQALVREKASPGSSRNPESLYRIAAIEASLGETEAALEALDAAVAAGWLDFRSPRVDPRFDSLASDSRFHKTLSSVAAKVAELRRQTGQPLTMAAIGDAKSPQK